MVPKTDSALAEALDRTSLGHPTIPLSRMGNRVNRCRYHFFVCVMLLIDHLGSIKSLGFGTHIMLKTSRILLHYTWENSLMKVPNYNFVPANSRNLCVNGTI